MPWRRGSTWGPNQVKVNRRRRRWLFGVSLIYQSGKNTIRHKSVPNLSAFPVKSSTYEFSVVVRLSSFASIVVTRVDKTSYRSQWINEGSIR
jgi:DNA-binding transcriptional regulator YbjK